MSFEALPERLAQVRVEIARLADQPVTIVAVTKGFGPDAIRAALAAGLPDIGENRVQEAIRKQDELRELPAGEIRWHLIGHVQRNKARAIPGRFELIHSLDSLELAQELDRRLTAPQRVLLQVNVAREPQKSGCGPEDAPALARQIAAMQHLRLEGLMTLAPFTDDEAVQRRTFRDLRGLRDRIKEEGLWLPTLSMGMSGDYVSAVREGATVIRLGTALFGQREATA
ncbi:MAG TPA: YggS family pyridoxal phosphate-dependent enzyme [Gemmatimonadales bacterium]|jgi:pyridoxal phosphate enzyme (YggS family)|nr:YggS family pyridoxal phosphate-dependent enzyme [Gemmatimonadales bacterium]